MKTIEKEILVVGLKFSGAMVLGALGVSLQQKEIISTESGYIIYGVACASLPVIYYNAKDRMNKIKKDNNIK